MKHLLGFLLIAGLLLMTPFLHAADGDLVVGGDLTVAGLVQTGAGQGFKIRYGYYEMNVNLAAGAGKASSTIPYGYTFASAPIVLITSAATTNLNLQAKVPSADTSGFTIRVLNASTGTITQTVTFNWIAIGQ